MKPDYIRRYGNCPLCGKSMEIGDESLEERSCDACAKASQRLGEILRLQETSPCCGVWVASNVPNGTLYCTKCFKTVYLS